MHTIAELEKQLEQAKAAQTPEADFPTGIIIDLAGPEGNVFYILGLCHKLFRQMHLEDEWQAFYDKVRGGYYKDALGLAQRKFGFIYLNEPINNKTKKGESK